MIDRKKLKEEARSAIRAAKPHPVWVTLMVFVILAVTQFLSLNLSGDLATYRAMLENAANGQFTYFEATQSIGVIPWLLAFALDLMTMVISVGYSLYSLRLMRGKNPGFGDVFDAFGFFLRAIWLSMLRSILISLATFLYAAPAAFLGFVMDPVIASLICLPLLAPMFILAYAYRLSDYILVDNPQFPAAYCLAMSRAAMKGRKWELFRLDLSFIGWILLCIVPVFALWVRPYREATCAGWYDAVMPGFIEELKKRPMPQTPTFRSPGGWSVPGEKKDEDEQDDDFEDHDWF